MKLRDYQQEAIDAIEDTFKSTDRQYIELPTGAGKTITFLSYAQKNHKKILIVVPAVQLLNQVYESALFFYHKSEISRKGSRFEEKPSKIHICIINSIRKDYGKFLADEGFDLVVFDEAHHVQAETYSRFIGQLKKTKILGVTATPDRLDGRFINELLHKCSFKIDVVSLINRGHLSDVEGYSVKTNIDLSSVDTRNGEFSILEIFKKLCTEDRNNLIMKLCLEDMKDRKTLIFCINVDHSKILSKMLNDNGLSCASIDGRMDSIERMSILKAFRDERIQFLTNCQLLTEGFDEPSIDGIILARPTCSKSLFNQMIGRGLRKSPGKINCKIIDIVDNHKMKQGFNNILQDGIFNFCSGFKNIKDLQKQHKQFLFENIEINLEKANIFDKRSINYYHATESMMKYLDDHKVFYILPVSYEEGSFLIWYNELLKEYKDNNLWARYKKE